MRTQEEVQQYFVPRLIDDGTIYQKIQTAYIRRAVMGEQITTEINGVAETTDIVKDSSSWIVRGKNYGEQYILTDKNFNASYMSASAKPVKDPLLQQMGFQEFQSKRSVSAHHVSRDDIDWLRGKYREDGDVKTGPTATKQVAYFVAPWGESTRVELGDLVVMQFPNGLDNEIYRIEKNVFVETYKRLRWEISKERKKWSHGVIAIWRSNVENVGNGFQP